SVRIAKLFWITQEDDLFYVVQATRVFCPIVDTVAIHEGLSDILRSYPRLLGGVGLPKGELKPGSETVSLASTVEQHVLAPLRSSRTRRWGIGAVVTAVIAAGGMFFLKQHEDRQREAIMRAEMEQRAIAERDRICSAKKARQVCEAVVSDGVRGCGWTNEGCK